MMNPPATNKSAISPRLCEEAKEWTKSKEIETIEMITEHRQIFTEATAGYLAKIAPPPSPPDQS